MPKLKQVPLIMAHFLKNTLRGDLRSSRVSLQKYLVHALDKRLKNDGIIRYSFWKYNNSKKYYRINNSSKRKSSDIKFAIIYFYEKELKKKAYYKILECLKNQTYNNYRLFLINSNIDDLISELDKNYSHICFIEQGDLIANYALSCITKTIQGDDSIDLIYSDEDVLNRFGLRITPYFKPQYAPLLLFSHNYMNAFLCLKLTDQVIREISSLKKINQVSIYKLVLKVMRNRAKSVRIADVLYHRHWHHANTLKNTPTTETIQQEIKARKLNAKILDYKVKGFNLLKFYPKGHPKISIIIPFRDKISLLRACIKSIETKSSYENYEIILIDNGSKDEESLKYLNNTKHRIIKVGIDFNYSKLNNMGAHAAEGKYLILLNNDTKVLTPDWMESLLGLAQIPEVGAVGAKLLYPNHKIQHAGIVMKHYHVNRFLRAYKGGYKEYNNLTREYSWVTGACLMIAKEKFHKVGGLTESLANDFNDIDFCFKLLRKGYYNIYSPHSVLYHYEAASREKKFKSLINSERIYMLQKWNRGKGCDQFYNPNFSDEQPYFCVKINKYIF